MIFACRAGGLGGLVTNLRFQEERNCMPRRSILSATERESLLTIREDTKGSGLIWFAPAAWPAEAQACADLSIAVENHP